MEGDRTNRASGQRRWRVDTPSTSQPRHKRHRFNEMIIEVSKAISKDSDVRKLGLELGVKNPPIDRALATNWATGVKTNIGNLEMLKSWAETVKQSEQIPTLRAALENMGLVEVAETCLPSCHTDNPTGMPDEILKLKKKLKDRYRKKCYEVITSPIDSASRVWLQHIYVSLVLMLGLKGEREEEMDYNGLFEKIRTETPRGFKTRFAFLGEAGVGKSTLFAKIALDWAEGRILQEIDLLFLESFREIEECKYFGDIVMNHFPDDMETEGKQVDKYIRENQRKVVILLDGLDEAKINIKRPNRNDAVVSMIRGERFTDTPILITTRPFGADQIKGIMEVNEQYTYIKVRGFSKRGMSTYIEQYFRDDPESASSLIMFMDTNRVAEHMAPFPIFCCMLCYMWKEPSWKETIQNMKTFSEVLGFLVFSLQERYSTKHGENYYSMNMEKADESMKDLSCLAFHGLISNQLIFDEEAVGSCMSAAMTACEVGILSKEVMLAPTKFRERYLKNFIKEFSFPHKLLQEYTASSYLVSLFCQDRPYFEKKLTDMLLQNHKEFRYILYFTAARGGEVGKRVMEVLCEKVDDTDFIMEVAYECPDREAIDPARNLLKIQTDLELRSHSDAGYLFTLATLGEKIERECSLVVAEKLAVGKSIKDHAALAAIGLCSLQDLRSLAICEYNEHTSLDDDFYTGMSAAASLSKIQELKHQASIGGLIKLGPTASCHYARGLCSMPNLRSLELKGVKPSDEFFATMASEASASKGSFPQITKGNFRFNGSSVESLESFKRMLSEYQGIVSEEEFGKLSQLTPPSHYMQVGKVLEIPDAQLSDIKNQSDNIIIAFKKVFKKWREGQPPGINIRAILVEKLKESELDEVAGRLHNLSLISNITAEPPTCPSPSATEDKGKTPQLWSKPIQSTSSMGETDPHDQGGVAVHWEFITDAPEDFILKEDEAEIACGIRFSPSGATFKEPVKVTMEHCAHFTDPSQAEIVFYTRSRGMTSFERIPASTKGYPCCDVRTKDLDLYVDHFCQWRIATKFNEYFKGKRVKCTPYVEPPVIKGSMHVVVLYIYDDLSKIKMKVEEEMTGYKKLHPPKSLNVAWGAGDVIIRLFEGPRRHRTLVDEKLLREQNFYQVSCDPESFFVEPPIGEANQKPLQFVLGQGSPTSTNAEILIVLRYDDRVQPSPPPSPPQSQTPSSSSSLPQSPLPLPSQPLLPSSLQPSSSSEPSSPSSVSQGELIKLAEDVPTRKYTELCNNMGFCPANSEQVLNKHSKDYRQALIEIFCAWHVNQETGNSRRRLTDILQNTCLLTLADRLETGHYLSTFDFDEYEEPSGAESEHEGDDSAQYPQTSGTRQKQKRTKGSSKGPGKKKSKR